MVIESSPCVSPAPPPNKYMRNKEEIQKDGTRVDMLTLEVLLDIRELLKVGKTIPKTGKKLGRPRGRPKKIK